MNYKAIFHGSKSYDIMGYLLILKKKKIASTHENHLTEAFLRSTYNPCLRAEQKSEKNLPCITCITICRNNFLEYTVQYGLWFHFTYWPACLSILAIASPQTGHITYVIMQANNAKYSARNIMLDFFMTGPGAA